MYEANSFSETISNNIRRVINSNLNKYSICLEQQASEDFSLNEIKVKFGDHYGISFLKTLTDIEIKEIVEGDISQDLKNNIAELIKQLKQNPKYNRVLNLYTLQPISERKYFENLKREMALGYKHYISKNITFFEMPFEDPNMDLWKIKINEQYLQKYQSDKIVEYKISSYEAPIRWIERIKDET